MSSALFLAAANFVGAGPPCAVLSGATGLVVQGLLLVCILATLWVKFRCFDASGRTIVQRLMDGGKQLVGAAALHVSNLLGAKVLATEKASSDQCAFYFVEIVVDTTVGVLITWALYSLLLRALAAGGEACLARRLQAPPPDFTDVLHARWPALVNRASAPQKAPALGSKLLAPEPSPPPSSPPTFAENRQTYLQQVAAWVLVVCCMKWLLVGAIWAFSSALLPAAEWLLSPISADPTLKLVVVMIATPLAMNAFQFWMGDVVLVRLQAAAPPSPFGGP